MLVRGIEPIFRKRVERKPRRYEFDPAEQASALTRGKGKGAVTIELDSGELFDEALHFSLSLGEDIEIR